MKQIPDGFLSVVFWLVCWIFSIYFLIIFHRIAGCPPVIKNSYTLVYLILSIFLLLIPFSKRIKVGNLIEFEGKIKNLQDDMHSFKNEIRQQIILLTSSITSINSLSNTINLTVTNKETKAAKDAISKLANDTIEKEAQEIETDLIKELRSEEDPVNLIPLVLLRIRIEKLLKSILSKRGEIGLSDSNNGRRYSASELLNRFIKLYPKHRNIKSPTDYVLKICNAAIHGQKVSTNITNEALEVGSRVIAILTDIEKAIDF